MPKITLVLKIMYLLLTNSHESFRPRTSISMTNDFLPTSLEKKHSSNVMTSKVLRLIVQNGIKL